MPGRLTTKSFAIVANVGDEGSFGLLHHDVDVRSSAMADGVGDGFSQHQRELIRQCLRYFGIGRCNRDRRCAVPVPCRFFQLPLQIAAQYRVLLGAGFGENFIDKFSDSALLFRQKLFDEIETRPAVLIQAPRRQD